MRYALMENGVVANVIWLSQANAGDFPGAVPIGNRPVAIGDSYMDGSFYRGGAKVLTPEEATIAELDAALLDATYENIIGGI